MNKDYILILVGYTIAILWAGYSNYINCHFLIYIGGMILSLIIVYHMQTIVYNEIIKKRDNNG
jgi:hypothetical protein